MVLKRTHALQIYVDDKEKKKMGTGIGLTGQHTYTGDRALPGPPHGEMRAGGSIRATTWGEGGRNSQLRAVKAGLGPAI